MLDEDAQIVLAALGARGRHPDEVAAALSMPAFRLQGVLLGLELAGFIQESGGLFRRVRG
jgi:predicted Rossmann fold nucleotide-binding protein DprA/Smf involved in DNA uptake